MLSRRLSARTPSAEFQSTARLPGHKLLFNKVSFKDGTGKCGIIETGQDADHVLGVLYSIKNSELGTLDQAEGLGKGYDHKTVELAVEGSADKIKALSYYPTNIKDGLKPFDWYKAFVVAGARENHLPDDYIQVIEDVVSVPDPDVKRAAENWQLLNDYP